MPRLLSSRTLAQLVLCGTMLGLCASRAEADDPPTEEPGSTQGEDEGTDEEKDKAPQPPPPAPEQPTVAKACRIDDQCSLGSICVDETCQSIRRKRRWVPPFYWNDSGPPGGYRHVPPFFFHKWSRSTTGTTDTKVVPLLLYSRRTTPTETADRIWPIFWHTRYRENGNTVGMQTAMLPLFWWQHRKGRQVGAVPLLLTGWQRDPERDRTEALVLGLGYYRRERKDVWRVGFPLFWDHEKQGSRIATLFPIFWYHRDGLKTSSVVFPLVWRFRNDETGTENLVLFPLLGYQKQRFGRRTIGVSLLGGYERDLDARRSQLLLLAPPYYHRRDPSLSLDVLLPIFARWKDEQSGGSGLVAGPLVHVGDREGSTTTLFPVYWRLADKRTGGETHLILPIAGYHQHPGARGAAVGPVFGWRSHNGEGGWGGGIAPVLFFGKSGPRRHAMLLPLFAWKRDASTGRQLTAVGPFFVRQNPPTHGVDVGLLPFLFAGKEDGRSYGYVPPLFWYRHTPERTTVVVGPAYGSKKANGDWSGGLAPIFFFGRRGERRYDVAFPLFFRTTSPNASTTVFLPFVHARRGDTTTNALFPLFYEKHSPRETTIVTPIGGLHRENGRAFGVIGPFIHKSDARTRTSTNVLFPIAFSHRSPGYDLTAIAPIFWHVRSGTERDTLVFPLFWHRRGGATDIDALFPLFLRSKSQKAATYIVGPYFARRPLADGVWRQDGLLGVFSSGQKRIGDKLSRFVAGPGFFYQRNDFLGVRRVLAGPVFDWRRPDGFTSGLFPVVWAWRRGTTTRAVTPIFYHQHDSATGLNLNVLGPLYWAHSKGATYAGIAPLFFGQYGKDGTSKTILFPILYYAKKKIGSTLVTPVGGFSSYDGGWRALVGPFYVRRDRLTSSQMIFPIFYHGKNRLTGSTTTVLAPLYLDRDDHVDGTRIQAFTPLVWRYRSVEQATIIAPLIFDAHRFGESRSSGFLPFFIRHRSEVAKSTWWSAPALLMWGRNRWGDENPGKDFVFFPLLWHFGSKDRTSTVFAPFVFDFKRGEDRTTVVFPIMARWTRAENDRLLVFNTYYRKGKGRQAGSWWFDFIPLFQFGRPRAQDWEWKILEGLVGYARQGRNRTLTLLWLIPITLEPVKQTNLGWFGSTPPEGRTSF